MNSAVYAVVRWCGSGGITLHPFEHEARESLALISARGCGPGCRKEHKLIKLGDVIA